VFTAIAEGTVTVTVETSNGLKDEITIEVYHTPLIVNILAALVVLILAGGVIGGPIFLIIWLKRRVKKNK